MRHVFSTSDSMLLPCPVPLLQLRSQSLRLQRYFLGCFKLPLRHQPLNFSILELDCRFQFGLAATT